MEVSVEELEIWLYRVPVIATVHPLVPLCFSSNVFVSSDCTEVLNVIDSPFIQAVKPMLILSNSLELEKRFPHLRSSSCPSGERINLGIAQNLDYARSHLLTTGKIADYIEIDITKKEYDTVIVFLVDGLSYADVLNWPCEVLPCFVDGPSVTYRYIDEHRSKVAGSIGFPSVVGRPSIYSRLYQLGYRNARGYTYWNRDNYVADFMFHGVPVDKVENFESVLGLLSNEDLNLTYVQIVREGLDGLAHSKREVRREEIEASVRGILNDIERLITLLRNKRLRACIYLTADHGILWKNDHDFQVISGFNSRHPRYSTEGSTPSSQEEFSVKFIRDGISYSLLKYPYLANPIKVNDSGVHGGLSYQESIVPFAKFEVKPIWN